MPNTLFLAIVAAIIAGALMATQSPVNASLARQLGGNPILAGFASFSIGTLVLGSVCLIRAQWPSMDAFTGTSWWMWVGGLFGAIVVTAMTWCVPQIGSVTTVGCFILGQMVAALMLDAFGAFGLAINPISPSRIAAVLFIGAGIWLSRL